jgi:hypothetical protein
MDWEKIYMFSFWVAWEVWTGPEKKEKRADQYLQYLEMNSSIA